MLSVFIIACWVLICWYAGKGVAREHYHNPNIFWPLAIVLLLSVIIVGQRIDT